MAKKLYIGNLSYEATEEDLRELFLRIGQVQSVKVVTDPATGRSRGFGFVEMGSEEEAQRAMQELDGTTFMNRALLVKEARPQAERERRGRGPGGPGRGGRPQRRSEWK
ncbi:MAG: RNA-binding protein [Nitrospirota bacterium]|jgi:RNA recognition motif-containing protein